MLLDNLVYCSFLNKQRLKTSYARQGEGPHVQSSRPVFVDGML